MPNLLDRYLLQSPGQTAREKATRDNGHSAKLFHTFSSNASASPPLIRDED